MNSGILIVNLAVGGSRAIAITVPILISPNIFPKLHSKYKFTEIYVGEVARV